MAASSYFDSPEFQANLRRKIVKKNKNAPIADSSFIRGSLTYSNQGQPATPITVSRSSGGSGGGSSRTATAKSQQTTQGTAKTKEQQKTAQQQNKTTGIDTRTTGAIDTKNIGAENLSTLDALIAKMQEGQDPILSAIDQAKLRGLQTNAEVDQQADPNAAAQRAEGRVQGLQRNLLEQVLPQIFGGAEQAGIAGNNALSMLLSQDAATRTSEASNRAMEEAYQAALGQRISNQGVLPDLLAGGSANTNALMDALGIAKGTIQTGVTENATTGTTTEKGTTTGTADTTGRTDTTGATDLSSFNNDPLAWAQLQEAIRSGQAQEGLQGQQLDLNRLLGLGSQDIQREGLDLQRLLGLGSQDLQRLGLDQNLLQSREAADLQKLLFGQSQDQNLLMSREAADLQKYLQEQQIDLTKSQQPSDMERALALFQATKSPLMDITDLLGSGGQSSIFSPINPSRDAIPNQSRELFDMLLRA